MRKITIILAVCFALTGPAFAQSNLQVKKVSIFKTGICMVNKEGSIRQENGHFRLGIPLQALYGTYWLGAVKDNTIKSILFKNDTLKKNVKARNLEQLLRSNAGRSATLFLSNDKGEKTVTGKLLDFPLESGLVKIKTDNGKTDFIEVNRIGQVEFTDDPAESYKADSIIRMATIKTDKASESLQLQEFYMQTGMSWIPSYFFKLNNDKDAKLEMKATIENYSEDFKDVETELVVGSPQLYFGKQLDPMTYDYLTSGATYTSSNTRMDNNYLSNAMVAQQAVSYAADMSGLSSGEGLYETAGEKSNDLFYYNLGKMSLAKNSKGNFPIFGTIINYKDKYEANIADRVNYAYSKYVDTQIQDGTIEVYHSLEFKNTTTYPLTTAAVMVVGEKNQFLAQDMLKYTPVGATSSIRLSKAIDIIMKNSEEEIKREDNIRKVGKLMYSRAVLKGSIIVENLQSKNVVVSVKKNVNGAFTSTGNGTVKKQRAYNNVNPNSEISWEVELKAGEKKEILYEYEVFFNPY